MNGSIHFWGIAGGLNAGFEYNFYSENNTNFPFDHFTPKRFLDERLFVKKLLSLDLFGRLDIVNNTASFTRYVANSDRQGRPAFTAGTYYFEDRKALSSISLRSFVGIDNAIGECVENQKRFVLGNLKYPTVDATISDYDITSNTKWKTVSSRNKIQTIIIHGCKDDESLKLILGRLSSSTCMNTKIYFINNSFEANLDFSDVLSPSSLENVSVFDYKSSDFMNEIEELLFKKNFSVKSFFAQYIKRLFFAFVIVLIFCVFVFNGSPHIIKKAANVLPNLIQIDIVSSVQNPEVYLFDTIDVELKCDSKLHNDSLVILQSSTHPSLIFRNVQLNLVNPDSNQYILRTILENDTTHLLSGNVEINAFVTGTSDTLLTSFDLDI